MFSCEFYEISKNVFFPEHLWETASFPIKQTFTSADADTHSKLIKLVGNAMQEYDKVSNDIEAKDKKKKNTTNRQTDFQKSK